ncbi:MAG: T9SS type A sorting domain-containing protein [Ignavibacteriae bacterium]|nr:T9SS type A sorting domain-containing protein [Ignavibacteriota bacterium]MBK8947218.1 T9SS type A sorting domain-containing protein [Ignavibacteriota bacterium]
MNETTQEKLFSFSSIELAQNDSVKVENPDSNKIKLTSFGSAKDYDIELNFVNENGIGRFGEFNIPLTSNSSHTITPNWNNVTNTDLKILVDEGNDGTVDDTLSLTNKLTGIENKQGSLLPTEYKLEQNYPNPFNPTTTISYQIPINKHVTIKVYDVLGREIATLIDEYKQAGIYKLEFNASQLVSGVYFYKLRAGSFVQTKKMIIMR